MTARGTSAIGLVAGTPAIGTPKLVAMRRGDMRFAWRRFRQHRDNSRRITNAANVVEAFGGKPRTAESLATMRKACKQRAKTSWLAHTIAANKRRARGATP